MITKSTKIYIAGHRGMVGSAVWRALESKGYSNLIGKTSSELEFKGEGVQEKAYIASCSNENYQLQIGKEILSIDPQYFRPTEVDLLIGDPSKAKEKLGWIPKYDLSSLVKDMMEFDINIFKK